MLATIRKTEILREPRWRRAVAGDAASAINIVLAIDPHGPDNLRLDLAMTVLVIRACEGNAAACVVVANVIARLPRAGDKQAFLSDAWAIRATDTLSARFRSGAVE